MKPLHPIMAALVAASVGTFPSRTYAAEGAVAPAGVLVKSAVEDPINALAKVLHENGGARADAGSRIEAFLLNADAKGKSFVAEGADKKALGAMAQEWVKKTDDGQLALLYFVIGPEGAAPQWARKDPVLSKTFLPGMKWQGRLREALQGWTGADQIGPAQEKSAASAFLNNALERAAAVFKDSRTKPELDASIAQNDATAVDVPDGKPGRRSALSGGERRYTTEDLYHVAAVHGKVYAKDDQSSRELSIKIYTSRDEKTGDLVNKIGIYDISDKNNITGRDFKITGSGEQTFTLNDVPNAKKYTLTLNGGDILVGRPGAKAGEAGTLSASVDKLMLWRADQAESLRSVVTVGGEDFYMVPQGGEKAAFALLPKGLVDNRANEKPRDLRPALYAEVGQLDAEGRTVNIPPDPVGPHLGKVGDDEYHLEFNKKAGIWEVKDGPGDKPKPKPKEEPTTAGGNAGGDSSVAHGGDAAGEQTPEQIIRLLAEDKKCIKPSPNDTKDLNVEGKERYGVISCKKKDGTSSLYVLVPKKDAEGQQLIYPDPSGGKLRGRFYKHYLILESEDDHRYLDLYKHEEGGGIGFLPAGILTFDKGKALTAKDFLDAELLVDVMKRHWGLSEADGATIKRRAAKRANAKSYVMFGNPGRDGLLVEMNVDGTLYEVFPDDAVAKDKSAANEKNKYAREAGPGKVFEGAVASENADFPDENFVDATHPLRIARKETDAALYVSRHPGGAPKEADKHYLMFKFKTMDKGKETVFRSKLIELFSSEQDGRHLPEKYEMMGLVHVGELIKDRSEAGYSFVSGTDEKRGVLAVTQNLRINAAEAKDKGANCAGPIFWWGVTHAEALQACKDEKL